MPLPDGHRIVQIQATLVEWIVVRCRSASFETESGVRIRCTRSREMSDFFKQFLDPDEYLTGTLVVRALDSHSGRGLFGVRVIAGSTLDEAFGKR